MIPREWYSLLIVAVILGCTVNEDVARGVDPASTEGDTLSNQMEMEKLLGRWVHSYEDDNGDRVVYRASDYAFPPSRGRDAFTLDQNGVAQIGSPGPVDRGESAAGLWALNGDVLSIEAGNRTMEFTVESFDGSTLIMQRR